MVSWIFWPSSTVMFQFILLLSLYLSGKLGVANLPEFPLRSISTGPVKRIVFFSRNIYDVSCNVHTIVFFRLRLRRRRDLREDE